MKIRRGLAVIVAALVLAVAGCQNPNDGGTIAGGPPGATVLAASSCHVNTVNGQPLPDPTCTPGVLNPAVNANTIHSTICVSGWTKTVRPPESYTENLKREDIAAYGFADIRPADYEQDHRVPLEVGGAPRDARNLWPQGYERAGTSPRGYGSESKDKIENYVRAQVCAGAMTLAAGQAVFLGDWWTWRADHMPRSTW
jgi:hypothetical protein